MLVEDIRRNALIEFTKSAKISCKEFSYGVSSNPFLDLRSSKMEQMKGIDALKNKCLLAIFSFMLVGGI